MKENLYHHMIINDFEKINVNVNGSRMEQRSMLRNIINYVQFIMTPIDLNKLDVNALELIYHKRIYDRLQ